MHIPRKRFGQNFLSDQGVVQQIVAALAPRSNEHLVEIGPGQGALTLPVMKLTRHLEAIELDRDLIPQLQDRVGHLGELTIHSADALEFDFASIKKDDRQLRVFGNLPYNISTPLIFHLLSYAAIISDMLFMLQKEVVERLAAQPNDEHYGRLSVMVQYHCQADMLFDVPPTAFFPQPQVTSSIIKLTPYKVLPFVAKDYDVFAALVKQAFSMRRKTLRNSLKHMVSDDVWRQVAFEPSMRPESLGVEQFVTLANVMVGQV